MAPEVLNILNREISNEQPHEGHTSFLPDFYDLRCDVWSLGVCIYTLLEGDLPYSMEEMSKLVVEGIELPMLKYKVGAALALDFIRECLQIDFRIRPAARRLLQHQWLKPNACGPTPHSSSTIASRLRSLSTYVRKSKLTSS